MSGTLELFGQIDIYLFDQLLRGRIGPGMRILDAGCGNGRNLLYLLQPGGLFFCRLASSIGLEGRGESLGGRRYRLPDRSERYLVDEPLLLELTRDLGGVLLDPLKTTVVQGQRRMTTWVVRKAD